MEFELTERVIVITGGAGLLGRQHAAAVASMGGVPVLLDIDEASAVAAAEEVAERYAVPASSVTADITNRTALDQAKREILARYDRLDGLINNAAHNPTVEGVGLDTACRLESLSLTTWNRDLSIGLTGAFLCSQCFGAEMAARGQGVIVNIASDLSVIAPDQRLYRKDGLAPEQQPVKPVTYSVVKSGLVGLTRYLATYWADQGVRVNAVSPGGVANGQDELFVSRLTQLIPMGRMAQPDEYRGVVIFLLSDASAYMTGTNVVMDGGRSCW